MSKEGKRQNEILIHLLSNDRVHVFDCSLFLSLFRWPCCIIQTRIELLVLMRPLKASCIVYAMCCVLCVATASYLLYGHCFLTSCGTCICSIE